MNLFWFLTSVIQYNLSWNKRTSVQQMKQMLASSGAVWQKFTQMLSGHEELIGKDLANEFQSLYFDCPAHTDEYSREVIRRMFGDKYDLVDMKMIGSGTIAQVYKVGDDKCIKVRHPNVVREVMDAVDIYDGVKNMFFMPISLKSVCDNFFEGLIEQLDFHREFENGTTFKQLMHGDTDGTNNLFIIPNMLDTSDECLVMEYEPSECIATSLDNIDKHVLLRFTNGLTTLSFINILHGFIHADIHLGNYGIRNPDTPETMRIVIYDFGHMYDVRDLSFETRCGIVMSFVIYDIHLFIDMFTKTDATYRDKYIHLVSGSDETGNVSQFQSCITKIATYSIINKIQVYMGYLYILLHAEKYTANNQIIYELIQDEQYHYMYDDLRKSNNKYYYDKYYPFDDIQILTKNIGHCITR
jgi:predicted unusual protein kinase regulating ubiquinone biosynthesis (AarF/ABC1/UbiB family)